MTTTNNTAPWIPFAAAVHLAAETAERFGDRKAFISSVYDRLAPWAQGTGLAEFKARLVHCQMIGLVNLARADLVGAMDPRLVAASEIEDRGASFHFVNFVDRPC